MSTGDLDGLHSSGKGFGMDEENDSAAFDLQKVQQKKNNEFRHK